MRFLPLFILSLTFIALPVCAVGAGDTQAEGTVQFNRDILPILSNHCFACHGPDANERQGGLRLDIPDAALAGGDSGEAAWVPGDATASSLFNRVSTTDEDERMPPPDFDKQLSPQHISLLKQWIDEGAPYREHWAYVAPVRPALPKIASKTKWPRNAIDAFVLAPLEQKGKHPSPAADRRTLIRRLSFDLIGLPPTIAEVEAFVNDSREDAYQQLVERLLASPHYGERMAQDWLDAARYADTTGFAADSPRTGWLFRDWVIDAINANMPFDQFTIEQLAGDMLPEPTEKQKIATGFHRLSMQALGDNPRKEEFRIKGIVDRLDTTGRVWLGLTLSCAECHAHKYDPISQKEYYQLFAIFNNVPHLGEKMNIHGPRMEVTRTVDGKEQKVAAQIMEEMATPRETFVHVRGDYLNHGEQVAAAVPDFLPSLPEGAKANRLAFARWLVSPEHPLTARVTVNRIWRHYFGTGLVRTVDDFGVQGEHPSHPKLLDWLAVEFIESGWNTKHIHRLIVSSATYRQTSRATPEDYAADAANRRLARGPRVRLPAEQIRDNALAIGGLLERRLGGPSVYPLQPEGLFEEKGLLQYHPKWETSAAPDRYRRGLYVYWKRMNLYPSLAAFGAPTRERCRVDRAKTNTPLQALVLLNDPVYQEAAAAFADQILVHGDDAAKRITYAYQRALSRAPNEDELRRATEFITELSEHFQNNTRAALDVTEDYPPRERAFPSDGKGRVLRAPWVVFASTLLNLDETITKE